TPEQVLDSYGAVNREIAAAPGAAEVPAAPAVAQALEALKRYQQALRSGDAQAVYRWTSRLSPDYAARFSEFLQRASLNGAVLDDLNRNETRTPQRFVSRALIHSLIRRNASQSTDQEEFAQSDIESRSDFGGMAFTDGHAKFRRRDVAFDNTADLS